MIMPHDFARLMQTAERGLFDLAVEYMTSYSKGNVTPRDEFTENVLEMLEILLGNPYNRSGSFTKAGAEAALDEEAKFTVSTFELRVRIYRRLHDLERGATSWEWLERQWASTWRPQLYKSGNRALAASISTDLKSGNHKGRAPARPYMELAADEYADTLAENLDIMLRSKLSIRSA